MKAYWIWYDGDYEVYHHMKLHLRREEYGYAFPPMWHISRPEVTCTFSKAFKADCDMKVQAHVKGTGYISIDGKRICGAERMFTVPAGYHQIDIVLMNEETFPAVLIDNDSLVTDGSWEVHFNGAGRKPAGYNEAFTSPDQDPAVFPFSYRILKPVSEETVEKGKLYDYGDEYFGPVTVTKKESHGKVTIYYGESGQEALDTEYAYLRQTVDAGDQKIKMKARAYRYLYVVTEKDDYEGEGPEILAEEEYLDIEDKFRFDCSEDEVQPVLRIASRALHLNSREFFLDGIKRDRWLWGGDACQSFMVARYLFGDRDITRRTIRAVLGKFPYIQHINRINDYSAYMFPAAWDYYMASGDLEFIKSIWDNLTGLYDYITGRLDPETGYVIEQPGDWIFIDWAPMDKEGPISAEQILLYQVYLSMDRLTEALRAGGFEVRNENFRDKAAVLKERILKDFWDAGRHAFIDTFASGKRNVTRHANIYAVIYDFVDDEKKQEILNHVLLNDEIPPITTPFFKLFELMAFAELGKMEAVQDYIINYWGGMVKAGATTAWEQYDPAESETEHYSMYGDRYGRSLCHAWGAGPVLLLGRYCAGVKETAPGASSFTVAPQPGRYKYFRAEVPVGNGLVKIDYTDGHVTVSADIEGGTLLYNGEQKKIPAGIEVRI